MKKRKLNSKNPKYRRKSETDEPKIKKRELIREVRGTKIYAIFYEN